MGEECLGVMEEEGRACHKRKGNGGRSEGREGEGNL